MRPVPVLAAFCFLGGWLAACSGGFTSASDAGSDGAPPVQAELCGENARCHSAAPTGWEGPGLVKNADEAAPCGGDATFNQAIGSRLNDGLSAPAAKCECACGPLEGTCTYTYQLYENAECVRLRYGNIFTKGPNVCGGDASFYTKYGGVGGTPRSCSPKPTTTLPPTTWAASEQLCGGAFFQGTCRGGELCVAGAAKLCIARKGDVACPAGPFSVKRLRFGGIAEGRACTECTCTRPANDCTPVGIGDCRSETPNVPLSLTGCYAHSKVIPVPDGACTPSVPTPTGAATGVDPTTLCCEP